MTVTISKKFTKRLLYVLAVLVFLYGSATFFIGGYFVNYALVAKSGGQKRPKVQAQLSTVIRNKELLENKRDAWLKENQAQLEPFQFTTADGLTLQGHKIRQKNPSNRWLIIVHGYQSNEKRSLLYAQGFYNYGYNIVTYSLRGHRPSEGKYITMGAKDASDLQILIKNIIAENQDAQIVLHGTSMGGATVLLAAATVPEQVKAVIADCAYSDLFTIFSKELKFRFNLPSFPVLYMAQQMAQLQAGFTISAVRPLDAVKKASVPIMFVHTAKDDFVPADMSLEMYAAKKGEKDKFIIPGDFGHAEAIFSDSEEYFRRIQNFCLKYLNQN